MTCTINWNALNFSEWEQRFKQIKRANLLQSYPYAMAMRETANQTARWGVIRIDEKEAGLVQILEAGVLKNLIHAVILDRGPLWFDGFDTPDNQAAFFAEFNHQFPVRFGRKRRVIPETQRFEYPNFKKTPTPGYQTLWLDLRHDRETLRKNLKKNWRGTLQKAEKADLTVEWDDTGQDFAWFMKQYVIDRAAKGYEGPSVKLIHALAKHMIPRREMLIGKALKNAKPVAGVMILLHGTGATYQIGFTDNTGRASGAQHIVLWNALSVLKDRGITDFDLGGVNDDTAKGIKQFKQGMGGTLVQLPGLFT